MSSLTVRRDEALLTVTINRANKLNALSTDVLNELSKVMTDENANPETRGMLITGAGDKAFIAGADIAAMSKMSKEEGENFCALGQRVTSLLESAPFPIVACVDGFALGGGCEVALSCDQIFATETSVFGLPEVLLGLIPGFGGCVRLTARVGIGKAKDLIFTGKKVSAATACQIGLVDQMFVAREDMLSAAQKFLDQMYRLSPTAIAAAKQAIHGAIGEPTSVALEKEQTQFKAVFDSADSKEGMGAFLAKRPPDFNRQRQDI